MNGSSRLPVRVLSPIMLIFAAFPAVALNSLRGDDATVSLAKIRQDALGYAATLQVPGKPLGWYFEGPQKTNGPSLYASCDVAHLRTITGEDLLQTLSAEQRAAWIAHINSFAKQDGTYGPARARHSPQHANGMVVGALGVLGGRQEYPVRLYEAFDTPEKVGPWLESVDWHKQWSGSHLFWGGMHCFSMSQRCSDAWREAVFEWLDANLDPETGWWRKGVVSAKPYEPLGGGAHIWPIYQHHGRRFPYPERVIDSILALQKPDGSWLGFGNYMELDALYGLAYMGSLAPGHRHEELLDAARRHGRGLVAQWGAFLEGQPDLHVLLGAVGAFGLLQQLLPERYTDSVPWTDIFSDRRLYQTNRVESPARVGESGDRSLQVRLAPDNNPGFLSVVQGPGGIAWNDQGIATITWWNAKGDEESQAVSPVTGWQIEPQSFDKRHTLTCRQAQSGFSMQIRLEANGDVLTVCIPSHEMAEQGEARLKSIRLLPNFGAARRGDQGCLVIPKDVGLLCKFRERKAGEYDIPIYGFNNGNMPLFGLIREEGGFAGIVTSGQFHAQLHLTLNMGEQGRYSLDPVFILRSFATETRSPGDCSVAYHFLPKGEAGWLAVAKRYRQYNAETRRIEPLRERVKNSPELAYSAEALEVRLRMGVKPVPTPVEEQTPETEPPVRVFLTFPKLREIFDEFHRQGIGKAEFCVVGWHSGGHDGHFPQLFPVEKAFGGEEELRKAIAHGQSLGYQIVSHDCYDDSYRISKDWSEENVRKKPDGQLWKGAKYAGGQSYNLCRIPACERFVKRDEPRVRALGFKGVHYNDVLSIVGPYPCYDPKHPATRQQDAEASNRILALSKQIFGGVQSEGPLDFAAPVLDRVLYITIHSKRAPVMELPYADEMVPLYPAVYHGTLLYNIWNDCVNTQPGDDYYLKNIEYGGMPVGYFYGHFWLDPARNWLGDRDLHYDSKEGLQEAVRGLRPVFDDLQKVKHLQWEFIQGHRQLADGIFETLYGNGERVVVNYTEAAYTGIAGEKVPAKGFTLIR